MIKLLAIDIDGTLLNGNGSVSDRNRSVLEHAVRCGVKICIATGRRLRDALPVANSLGFDCFLITHNGALVRSLSSNETLFLKTIPAETVKIILELGKNTKGDALISCDPFGQGTLFYETISEKNTALGRYLDWARGYHGEAAEQSVIHLPEIESVISSHTVIHISYSGDCQSMQDLMLRLQTNLGSQVAILPTVYRQLDFTLIDVLPFGVSKGAALARLSEHLGIGREEIAAIGDNFNDLAMLEFAKFPFVMANADPELLARTDFYKTSSNSQDGVAHAVEKLLNFGEIK
jgi:Cof subfamily protein (haloacid dehalogenase superfamily)